SPALAGPAKLEWSGENNWRRTDASSEDGVGTVSPAIAGGSLRSGQGGGRPGGGSRGGGIGGSGLGLEPGGGSRGASLGGLGIRAMFSPSGPGGRVLVRNSRNVQTSKHDATWLMSIWRLDSAIARHALCRHRVSRINKV